MVSRRIVALIASVCLLSIASISYAQDQGFDASNFTPPMDNYGLITMDTTKMYKPMRFGTAFVLHYMYKPLEINELGPDGASHARDLLNPRLKGDINFAVAFCRWYEMGFDLPFVMYQDGSDIASKDSGPSIGAFGDIRLNSKFRALDREEWPVGLSFVNTLTFPTGDKGSYFGNNLVNAEFKAVVDYELGPVLIATNLGYRIRDEVTVFSSGDTQNLNAFSQQIDDEFMWAFGAEYQTPVEDLSILSEFRGLTLAESPFDQRFNNPIFWDVGARYIGPLDLIFSGGLEVGVVPGYGAGPVGFYLGVGWSWDKPDTDKDTLPDEEDQCPEEPEDLDGFEDEDGCPDVDNDKDGVLDVDDACPDDPEDLDDYRDEDGCMEPDNDSDGILDVADKCPNTAEDFDGDSDEDGCPDYDTDMDGIDDLKDICPFTKEDFDKFQDEDGCPEPDNDNDSILDQDDKCPLEAEDPDSFEDLDGCPDYDNDMDGVLDERDRCPLEKEVINGNQDNDGCPDEGKQIVFDRGDHLEITVPIEFEEGLSMLDRKSYAILDQVAAVLRAHGPMDKLIIEAHTDNQGDPAKNMTLTEARAKIVANYIGNRGIDNKIIESKGFGGTAPIASNQTSRGRAKNRRLEFKIVSKQTVTPASSEEPGLVPLVAP